VNTATDLQAAGAASANCAALAKIAKANRIANQWKVLAASEKNRPDGGQKNSKGNREK
jgi:hypothetical protein